MKAAISRATAQDLDAVLRLLAEVDLPAEGVTEHFDGFFVARDGEAVVGCVGEERYGGVSLLRSLAVAPSLQRSGLGKALTARLLDEVIRNSVGEVVLLTTTAADFFARHFGFAQSERKRFDEAFAASPEWRLPRCSSAICMILRLSE
ncbi:MAG: GNAT family N-acetyltransferase [Blastocatellales bacterium]